MCYTIFRLRLMQVTEKLLLNTSFSSW